MSKRNKRPRPTTEAQRAAARANGSKSHGPVTDEGKAKAAMNALRHGLTAATLVLTTEDKPKFDELLNAYIDEYRPATQTESDLVQEIAVSKWLQRRCWALQTALIDVTMDRMEDEIDEEFTELPNATRTALAFVQTGERQRSARAPQPLRRPPLARVAQSRGQTPRHPKRKTAKRTQAASGPARPRGHPEPGA